jgi:class 3 adenylate cyclase
MRCASCSSRLSSQAAAGKTLIGPRLFAAVEERVEISPAGELELKGFGRPIDAYEVLAVT